MRWVVALFGCWMAFGLVGCFGECQYDADCSGSAICREGKCTDNLVGKICNTQADCQIGQECLQQKCVTPECQGNAQEPCYDGPPATKGIGLCQGGVRSCSNGKWGPCFGQILPTSEVCDKLDNDCNNKVDDSPSCSTSCKDGETRECFTGPATARGKGVCRAGTETCKKSIWGPCLGQTLPAPAEVCGDNLDNNCNNDVDEGCGPCQNGATRACYTGPANTRNVGLCKDGQQTCQNGSWTACSGEVKPSAETCDGKDNDCNSKPDDNPSCQGACTSGQTRECYTGPAGTKGIGICKAGTETCNNGQWGPCTGEVKPNGEQCGDNKDNNCNNQVDEGCGVCTNGTQEVCYSGQKGCSKNPDGTYSCNTPCRSGTRTCQNGQWTNCVGETLPLPKENCGNNIDDDCNGQVDDNCGVCTDGQSEACYSGPANTKNIGSCKSGLRTCQNRNWGPCIGEVLPGNEVCNDNKDNNCNGTIDENCSTKLHKTCQRDSECDAGQICLLAGSQGICFQNCSSNGTVCGSNADGRTTCRNVAQDSSGNPVSICVKEASRGAACNAVQSVFCTTGNACLGGTCQQVVEVSTGGTCDNQASPPRLCKSGASCVSFGTGYDSICLRQCDPAQSGSCGTGFVCAPLQAGGGICLQSGCTSDAQCQYPNHQCVNDSTLGTNICAPKPQTGPVAYAGVCDPNISTKRCQSGLFCLRLQGASTGFCSRTCTSTCPSASAGTAQCVQISAGQNACLIACTSSCPTGLRCQAVGSSNFCFP